MTPVLSHRCVFAYARRARGLLRGPRAYPEPPPPMHFVSHRTSREHVTLSAPPVSDASDDVYIYSDLVRLLKERRIDGVTFSSDMRELAFEGRGVRGTVSIAFSETLLRLLHDSGAAIDFAPPSHGSVLPTIAISLVMYAALIAAVRFSQKNPMQQFIGTQPCEIYTSTTFDDVAGIDGARFELEEITHFLREPQRFAEAGATIPKGCILYGPPGVGKTLLAKAIAGEAAVPFLATSASQFVEMFVGVGASRIRALFEKARGIAPCIVFIDELDAIGKRRGGELSHDEREQTLNQLLTEMDGFATGDGVIVIAATNRVDTLDEALLRPGRFDRKIRVELPSRDERERILRVHSRNKKLTPCVDLHKIAGQTTGFSGADLANLMNESAIYATRDSRAEINANDVTEAVERVMVGLPSPRKLAGRDKLSVAYHEAGHALVAYIHEEHYDPVHKISILPRGSAAGITVFAPDENDNGLYSRAYLEVSVMVALAGHAAEELVFGTKLVTTGASNDFQRASMTAHDMVTKYGFSGLGKGYFAAPHYGETTKAKVDLTTLELLDFFYDRTYKDLEANRVRLDALASLLLDKELVTHDQLRDLMMRFPSTEI